MHWCCRVTLLALVNDFFLVMKVEIWKGKRKEEQEWRSSTVHRGCREKGLLGLRWEPSSYCHFHQPATGPPRGFSLSSWWQTNFIACFIFRPPPNINRTEAGQALTPMRQHRHNVRACTIGDVAQLLQLHDKKHCHCCRPTSRHPLSQKVSFFPSPTLPVNI